MSATSFVSVVLNRYYIRSSHIDLDNAKRRYDVLEEPRKNVASWTIDQSIRKGILQLRMKKIIPKKWRCEMIFIVIAACWIGLDQVTKQVIREVLERGDFAIITSFFRISHIHNDGAAFGLFPGTNVVLTFSVIVALIIIVGLYYLFPPVNHWAIRLGLVLVFSGAMGNLLDRIFWGHVTDFIDFLHFPAFNVADAGINIGIAIIVIHFVFFREKPQVSS